MKRRDIMKNLTLGAAAGVSGILRDKNEAVAQTYSKAIRGLPPLKITNIKAILTAPSKRTYPALTVVKVETSEAGLYGIGCASYTLRPLAVKSAVDDYLNPFCKGKSVDNIEDMWQTAYVSSYWRNGPVLNNAMSGLDQALWDIKGKRANMPVYQLLGGKCRFAVDTYAHAGGGSLEQLEESVRGYMEEGYRHVRIQVGGYGSGHLANMPHFKDAGFGLPNDGFMASAPYVRIVPRMFEYIRNKCGDEIELLHDIHERIHPMDAINMVKEVEQYHPFFIEDPFAPEDNGYFRLLRQQTSTPIAMGELFNSPHEWTGLISERLIDYIRIHISQIGGITPAMKVARLGEWFNVRTAWHGPGDVSPVGHAANAHIDLAVWNFGIQERIMFNQETMDVFPGHPTMKNGYMYVNEAPGLGVDIDEKLAAKFPVLDGHGVIWTPIRRPDGTSIRP
ncbi:enolase C-terminal domain-like protein [Candidatus Latescibacterota bacterium]